VNEEEIKLRDEAYGRLRIWRDGCREIHDRAKESRNILLLQDPKQDEQTKSRRQDKKTIQLQTLKSTFNNCIADQMDNMPEALMLPETKELEHVAEDLTDIVRFVMAQNNYESLHRRRVEDCFCTGTAITQVAWDPEMSGGRGDVCVIRWPVENFLWDPIADTLQDARALFKVSWHPLSWYEQHYPEKAKDIGSDSGEYSGLGVPEAQEENLGGDEDRAMMLEYWYRLYDAKQKRYTINVAYLAGGVLLANEKDVYAHGLYPFVADVFTPIEGLPVGDGLVQELAPMMRYVNRYANYIDMNLRMSSKGRLLVDRAAGIDKEALLDWETDVVEGDRIDASALTWMQNQPFTGAVTQQMLQLQMDIKQDSGQNQFSRGETAGGVTAASAISALQEAGGKITRLRTNVLNQGYKAIVEQVMWLISQFYDKKRVMFITGEDNSGMHEVDASPEHLFGKSKSGRLPVPPYTVQIQVQRRNPLRQQAQNELFMQAYSMAAQAGAPFPLSVLFKMLHVDGKERILPEIVQFETLQQQMQEMASMNEQLTMRNQELEAGIANLQEINAAIAEQGAMTSFTGGAGPSGVNAPEGGGFM
jgi:hypothetical protein